MWRPSWLYELLLACENNSFHGVTYRSLSHNKLVVRDRMQTENGRQRSEEECMKGGGRVTSKAPAASASPSTLPRGCVARSAGAGTYCVYCVACDQCVLYCVAAQRWTLPSGQGTASGIYLYALIFYYGDTQKQLNFQLACKLQYKVACSSYS